MNEVSCPAEQVSLLSGALRIGNGHVIRQIGAMTYLVKWWSMQRASELRTYRRDGCAQSG